jgi:two-component system, OmpR family, response regulator
MRTHILAVDDDSETRDLIASYLARYNFRVSTAADGEEMRRRLSEIHADLITLDIKLPGQDGLALMRDLRATSNIPIVIVSALDDAPDRILGLEMGADDYVTKPFNPRELLARIKTVLRRVEARGSVPRGPEKERLYRFAGWEFDRQLRKLSRLNGRPSRLTHAEIRLLLAFLESPQRVLSREQLLAATHGCEADVFDRCVNMQVLRLRRKLEADPSAPALIRTERNRGYVFTATVEVVTD